MHSLKARDRRHQPITANESRLVAMTDSTCEKSRRDGGIRTNCLVLPNRPKPVAGRSGASAEVASTCDNVRQTSPGGA